MTYHDPDRNKKAQKIRDEASTKSTATKHPKHHSNKDTETPYLFDFTKGLSHGENGLLTNPSDFVDFAAGTQSHDPHSFENAKPHMGPFLTAMSADFQKLNCDDNKSEYRQWESPTAGHAYVLEGPDPGAITMPPAPKVGSAEFVAEIGEVYQMALGRDWGVAAVMSKDLVGRLTQLDGNSLSKGIKSEIADDHKAVVKTADVLGHMRWFNGQDHPSDTPDGVARRRRRFDVAQTPANLFRGQGEDSWDTPFLSQFMIMGSGGCTRELDKRASGKIVYGAQTINQEVRIAHADTNYMMEWPDYVDIQNGLNKRPLVDEFVAGKTRIMSRLRDLATYVHDDQLYQAYLNAALIMLDEKFAFDPGIPFHGKSANPLSRANREPFALFGGPHLLTLVTEVSSRALKAVRLQKFTVHRRLRPEAAGALFHKVFTKYHPHRDITGTAPYDETGTSPEALARNLLGRRVAPYTHPYVSGKPQGSEPALDKILADVHAYNKGKTGKKTWLLPMAFPEGSPMHPAYGAGHATVAGACVTLLKAFFNMSDHKNSEKPAFLVEPKGTALVPDRGTGLADHESNMMALPMEQGLTLEGELNKLLWNISNGRNIAGVHYYTDYIESALLGEAITIGILREQMLAYHEDENVEMTVPLLVRRKLPDALTHDADPSAKGEIDAVIIRRDGTLAAAPKTNGR